MTGGFVNASLYSLTQVVTITHTGSGTSSGDAELRVPDGGASIVYLAVRWQHWDFLVVAAIAPRSPKA